MILSLQKVEFFFNPFAGLGYCELELLSGLWRALIIINGRMTWISSIFQKIALFIKYCIESENQQNINES